LDTDRIVAPNQRLGRRALARRLQAAIAGLALLATPVTVATVTAAFVAAAVVPAPAFAADDDDDDDEGEDDEDDDKKPEKAKKSKKSKKSKKDRDEGDEAAAGDEDDEDAEDAEDDEEVEEAKRPPGTTEACIDQEIANRLAVKRKRRGAVDRLVVKQARHEFTAMGGYYSSDLFSSTYAAGGIYTYHMTESTAVEFGGMYTRSNADIIRALEDSRGVVLDEEVSRVILVESLLLWTPIYGKLRIGGHIMRFDINLAAGVGVVDAETSRGATGVAGFGLKLFLGKAVALRIDARDHVFQQELLDEQFLVNDVSITSGLSLFLPFGN